MKNNKFLVIGLLTFILLAGIVQASVSGNVVSYSYSSTQKTQTASVTITNTGTTEEIGVIELGIKNPSDFLSLFSEQTKCDYKTPWNVHRQYDLLAGQSASFTLSASEIPDGTWYPVLTHVNKCCSYASDSSPCTSKDPFGWDKRLTSAPITFGNAAANSADQCNTDYEALQYVRQHGSPNCATGHCLNAETLSSTAQCATMGECAANGVQSQVCTNGVSIDIRYCNEGKWQSTGASCTGQPLAPTPAAAAGFNWFWVIIGVVAIIVFIALRKLGVIRW